MTKLFPTDYQLIRNAAARSIAPVGSIHSGGGPDEYRTTYPASFTNHSHFISLVVIRRPAACSVLTSGES